MASTASYMLKFGADATSVTKAITGVNSDIRSMGIQARNLDTAFKLTGDTSALKGKLQALSNQLSATEAKGKLLKDELSSLKASSGFDANSAKAQKLTNDIAKTESEAVKLKAQLATAKTSSLDSASSSMGGLTSKIGAGTIAMGSFIGSIASNVVGKAFSLITSNIEGAVTRIDTLNNATRNFQNMGVKTSVVTKEMNNLKSAINGLPTPLDSAVSGVQLLTSSLNGDMPQSVKVFKALNDGILGFGGNSEQVTNSITQLSQAFSNGKIDAETWNSMIDSGLGPTLNALAKTMGLTTGQLKTGLSEGTISVSQFNDALINLDKNGGGGIASLSQIASDGTKGISTSFANAKTSVTRGVAEMITSVNNGIAGLDITTPLGKITGIGSIISQFGTVIEKTFDGIASGIAPTIQAIGAGVGSITSTIGSAYNTIKGYDFSNILAGFHVPDLDFTPLITLAQQIIPSIQGALSSLDFSGLQSLASGVIAGVIGAFQNLFNIVSPAIQPLITAIGGLGDAFQPLLGALSNLWNALQPILSVLGGVLMVALAGIGAIIGGVLMVAITALTVAVNVLSGVFQALAPVINVIASVIANIIPAFVDFGSMVAQVFSSIVSTVSGWVSSISSFFSSVGSAFGSLGSLFSSIGSSISGAFSAIGNVFGNVVSSLLGFFANMSSSFSSVGGVFAGVGSCIGGVASSVIGFFAGIGGKILSGFGNIGSSIAGLFSGVVGKIGAMFSGVADIGRNIVEGIKNGITGAIGGLVSTAADMAKQALNSAKKALGIHSPSRVFRDEVGRYITQGIGVGMEKETGYLANSSDAVKNSLLSDWQNVNLNTSLANGINSTSQGDLTAGTGTTNVFNITANTRADATAIASEVKTVLRQNGISAR